MSDITQADANTADEDDNSAAFIEHIKSYSEQQKFTCVRAHKMDPRLRLEAVKQLMVVDYLKRIRNGKSRNDEYATEEMKRIIDARLASFCDEANHVWKEKIGHLIRMTTTEAVTRIQRGRIRLLNVKFAVKYA